MAYQIKTVKGCERKIIRLERSVMNIREVLKNRGRDLTPQQGLNLLKVMREIEGERIPELRARIVELGELPRHHIAASDLFKGFM